MADFKDHFSSQSEEYNKYRPEYPVEFYEFLSGLCSKNDLVWDCATGSGQAARGLSPHFKDIHATDASQQQIKNATGPTNIRFNIADAANSGLKDRSVDMITVAQALHWFDLDKFYAEVNRVLKPNGILAVWYYGLMKIDDRLDPLFDEFYHDIVGSYWPAERRHIENGYADLNFPFKRLDFPDFQMITNWSCADFLGYLRTWSATVRYIKENNKDPVDGWQEKFEVAWGDENLKKITWPLTVLVGMID